MPNTHTKTASTHKKISRKRVILYIGRPFSGKDAQTKEQARLGIPVCITGDCMRKIQASDPGGIVDEAMKKGLAPDSVVLPVVAQWVSENEIHEILNLNGIPRNVPQMVIIEQLRKMGYMVCVVWFTTPETECMTRPSRPGREEEDKPTNRLPRMRTYDKETAPMFKELRRYNISLENGTLLCIDNTHMLMREVGERIIKHFGLPLNISDLFPEKKVEIEPAVPPCLATV